MCSELQQSFMTTRTYINVFCLVFNIIFHWNIYLAFLVLNWLLLFRARTSKERQVLFCFLHSCPFYLNIYYAQFIFSVAIFQCNKNFCKFVPFLCEDLEIKIINSKHHNYSCSFKYFIIQSNCSSSNAFKCCYGIPSRLFKMVTLFLGLLFMNFIRDDIF